jgi:hypothetical protein
MDITCINHRPTKDQAAKLLGIQTYDTALPHDWLVSAVCTLEKEVDPCGLYAKILSSVVWSYDQAKIFGAPHPLTVEAFGLLRALDKLTGSHCVDESRVPFNVLQIEE